MIPLRDDNPTGRTAFVTILLIGACVLVYFGLQPSASLVQRDPTAEVKFDVEHAAIPCEVVQGRPLSISELNATFGQNNADACDPSTTSPPGVPGKSVYLAVLLSMFLHGGLLHLGGNMLFLWIFGNNIEDRMGRFGFLAFYLAAGLIATAGHIALDPNSTVPVVGASGAIAGVMGAYLVLYPQARIHSLIFVPPFFLFFRPLRAWLMLGFWFVSQFFVNPGSGVAWAAHVVGFGFGALVALFLRGARPRQRQVVFR